MATAAQIDLSYSHVAPLMHTHLIRGPLAYVSLLSKRYLDRLIRFCTAHARDTDRPCYIRSVEVASPVSAEDAD